MRPTPHYPPAQSSTSARKDLYNAYGGGNGDAPQNGAEYAEYYNNSGKRGATSSDRSSNRPRPSLGSAQQQQQQQSQSDDEIEEKGCDRREAAAPPPPEPRQSSRPHSSAVMHNSKREPFRDLVEPNELYPLDTNGAPVFLPPLPYRAGLGPNGVPQPPTAESGQLVVHDPSRNRAMLLYDPRKIDPNAQPGMPMTLPSPANGYPRHANAPLVLPPPPKKVTRDHKIIKTRVTRTYRRGTGGADSENDTLDGEEDEDQVHEHESGSSWETSGSVSWEASSSGSSNNGDADGERGSTSDTGAAVAKISHVHRKKHENMSLNLNEAAALTKPCNDDDEGVKREGVNTSVAHHVKHSRRSKTTTTVCHVDDASEL